ncbi:hypothetical protein ARMSODRAFT_593025 [Armillaria solidipes]|uniref:Uncharacterized protein n=1 Tax=Armillaria solidipes TaxID=1076256 RepID=A0A2H3C826_9AGAR|nr:hypothetical protein ARMSODRAFT_593025 [Armillaria solidipes]
MASLSFSFRLLRFAPWLFHLFFFSDLALYFFTAFIVFNSMLGRTNFILLAVVGAGMVSAQSISLSSNCTDSLKSLLTSPDSACMNPSALLSFVVGTDQSIPNTINNWLSGLCSQGSCSDESIEAMVTNVTTGCTQELASVGAPLDVRDIVLNAVKQTYPTARNIACLFDTSSNEYCAAKTLSDLESVIGQFTLDDLSFFNLTDDAQKLIQSGVENLACTSCIKEGFTLAREAFPDIVSQIDSEATQLCGDSFIDGSVPENVSQTAVSGVFTTTEQANSGISQGLGGALMLVGVATVFILLG